MLGLLRRFFDDRPGTRLHLHFEAISGPWERLFDGEADLILHHIDKSDPRSTSSISAPCGSSGGGAGFPRLPDLGFDHAEQMRDHAQCIIRDTARHSPARDYFLIEGARSWTVSDQLMKREIILQGMGWGQCRAS